MEPLAGLQNIVQDCGGSRGRNWTVTHRPLSAIRSLEVGPTMLFFTKMGLFRFSELPKLMSSPLAQNTLWALGGYGTRLAIQAAYFIIMARYLGLEQYGSFIAATALVSLISPFV